MSLAFVKFKTSTKVKVKVLYINSNQGRRNEGCYKLKQERNHETGETVVVLLLTWLCHGHALFSIFFIQAFIQAQMFDEIIYSFLCPGCYDLTNNGHSVVQPREKKLICKI